jgi:hypothetical protein
MPYSVPLIPDRRPHVAHAPYRAIYFGTQARQELPDKILQQLRTQYIDPTCGSGTTLWKLHMRYPQLALAGSDHCLYVIRNLQAVTDESLCLQQDREEWYRAFCEYMHPDLATRASGFLTQQRRTDPMHRPRVSLDLAQYFDGLLQPSPRLHVLQALIGRYIASEFMFRAAAWSHVTTSRRKVWDITPLDVYPVIARQLWRIRLYAEQLRHTQWQVLHADAADALQQLDIKPGALVYLNPAWPWNIGPTTLPYDVFYYEFGAILAQESIPLLQPWTADNLEPIYKDVSRWLSIALSRNATVCLSTQSTNKPVPEELYAELAARGFKGEVWSVPVQSHRTFKPFTEWYSLYRP